MSRLSKQIAKEQAEAAATLESIEKASVILPPDVPHVMTPPPPNFLVTNKKLIIAIFAGITMFLGVYADILDIQFLQTLFKGN